MLVIFQRRNFHQGAFRIGATHCLAVVPQRLLREPFRVTASCLASVCDVVTRLALGPCLARVGDSCAARACFASIWKSLWWTCAASLGQPRAESFRRQQTISAHWEPDRRAALIYSRPSKSECRAPRTRAASPSPRHPGAPPNLSPPRLPMSSALHRQSYFHFSCVSGHHEPASQGPIEPASQIA